ncbi:MAG: hypothetical protein KC457_01540 [Myxococcales bacterium]|nr:hypothetical protein [Myxococcales bacterium]
MVRRSPLLVLLLSACSVDGEQAALGDCSVAGELRVTLGEGADGFAAIPDDGEPTLYQGSQGGTHLILGAQIETPDPVDHYTVTLLAEAGEAPCDTAECSAWTPIGGFTVELDPTSGRISQSGPTRVELFNLFLIVENWVAAPRRRVNIVVVDPCERSGSASRIF